MTALGFGVAERSKTMFEGANKSECKTEEYIRFLFATVLHFGSDFLYDFSNRAKAIESKKLKQPDFCRQRRNI